VFGLLCGFGIGIELLVDVIKKCLGHCQWTLRVGVLRHLGHWSVNYELVYLTLVCALRVGVLRYLGHCSVDITQIGGLRYSESLDIGEVGHCEVGPSKR